eukprot:TRINITY_DN4117_c0_g1_i8.p1 TRINITY_DN4117_c0_g1~~TRINITY_DN4117_c0_g1_i8.p1  ORF type:complete len:260 (-),score=20.94 TRINITY_DN4117_c0_g1_i8:274-1053(-)
MWRQKTSLKFHFPVSKLSWKLNSETLLVCAGSSVFGVQASSCQLIFEISHSDFITDVSASRNFFVTSSIDGTACGWDWQGKRIATFRLGICNALSVHGDVAAVGCQGKQIFMIDVPASRILSCTKVDADPVSMTFSRSGDAVLCFFAAETLPKLDFAPATELIVFTYQDGVIQRHNAVSGPKQSRFVSHPCWAVEDTTIVSGSEDSSIFCWTKLGVFIQKLTLHSGPINQVDSTDQGILVSASDDRTVRFWRYGSSECE